MSEIRFYHLQSQSLEQALPALVSKAYENGHRIVVRVSDQKQASALSDALWAFTEDSFIPHGTPKEGNAEKQPIWITADNDHPNDADVLIITDGSTPEDGDTFKLHCDIFDGRDDTAVAGARTRWKEYKNSKAELTYWKQSSSGTWDKQDI